MNIDMLKAELGWLLGCWVAAFVLTLLSCFAPPDPTLPEKIAGSIFGALQIYGFLLVCRLVAKGIARLFVKK
jgi:hypothetical protein